MKKADIISARSLTVLDMIGLGFTLEELVENGEITREYYSPSDSYEFFDGITYYNSTGEQLRDPSEYDQYSDGYTPFGDE